MSKTATVQTNEPHNKQWHLKVSGQVKKFADINPRRVTLRGHAGDEISATVTITPSQAYAFNVLSVKPENGEFLSCELMPPPKEAPATYRINVKNIKNGKGYFRDALLVKTDSEVRPQIRIDVYGHVMETKIADISPRSVLLRGKAGETIRQAIHITPKEKYPFEVLGITAERGENILYNLSEDKNHKHPRYVLIVENKMTQEGRYFDILSIKTSSKVKPELKITVTGIILKSPKPGSPEPS